MVRHDSGVFVRKDRVRVAAGTSVRLLREGRKPAVRALLMTLSSTDLTLTCAQPLELGARVAVAVTLPGRYIEIELPGVVEAEQGSSYRIAFDYLTARQAYGLVLAREVLAVGKAVAVGSETRALHKRQA